MNQKNISNTYALKGGTPAWKAAGYPMEGSNGPADPAKDAAPQPPAIPSNGPPPNY